MEQGLLHIYHGTGKGKTTSAMGLAVRAAGRDWAVCIAQFMKGSDTGERAILAQIPQITLLEVPETLPFFNRMTEMEKQDCKQRFADMVQQLSAFAHQNAPHCLLVLDEACSAVTRQLLDISALCNLLDNRPAGCEVVLTGRNPHAELLSRADYITNMNMERHPMTEGIFAREGVEF